MDAVEKREERSINHALLWGSIIILVLLVGVYAISSYWSDPLDETDMVICGNLPVDQQGACCSERHQGDLVAQCVGNWTYSAAASACQFVCAGSGIGQETIYCTQEAKQCPNGSYVSRDPNNNCEFTPCP